MKSLLFKITIAIIPHIISNIVKTKCKETAKAKLILAENPYNIKVWLTKKWNVPMPAWVGPAQPIEAIIRTAKETITVIWFVVINAFRIK